MDQTNSNHMMNVKTIKSEIITTNFEHTPNNPGIAITSSMSSLPVKTENCVKKVRAKKMKKLSDDQIRMNHVSSEKRRRELVREIYDELVTLVPDLQKNENRSELIIYLKTINYLSWLYKKNKMLRTKIIEEHPNEMHKITQSMIWESKEKN
ncbi:similar to Saccharomyces cerevisiae YOL108C INO4 Transcription factor required for derepression of inositol-choline-regulated genes involved in phospholipid synthesis [Maudiozyma saulgeensis]|uniref:Similar to Saccharomyces cerevisiae YOL108C INO4 Transcription factor required for derepression of inositol-choline-regulated genes involved in phospholipid synthesis n=1 Tax=Maudiozyma saulgeensis TaxID=1789683 RepID=A0A1X7R891_9SACH|nr:similar to Saccharomyces cerevisiae YOL108C INO4 Transcription factor required for derepression of inositol-choline-regulated genes involved in phospholipid synthesis [Kazachstania saulgeensis]